MLRFLCSFLFGVTMISALGCGKSDQLLIAKGQVLKSGEALIPEDEQVLQVGFIPITPDGKPARNWYVADVNQSTGAFKTTGPLKQGMPPGKYRVSVELLNRKKDLFKEKFNGVDSPFVVDINDTSEPILLDVELATVDTK